mmetsp:Transcript_15129/g.33100  ORF Transcript_15129/g.33100 Transcript_15129/m.33100 type:complete len:214 (-) Transcript_15129:152-793(-)
MSTTEQQDAKQTTTADDVSSSNNGQKEVEVESNSTADTPSAPNRKSEEASSSSTDTTDEPAAKKTKLNEDDETTETQPSSTAATDATTPTPPPPHPRQLEPVPAMPIKYEPTSESNDDATDKIHSPALILFNLHPLVQDGPLKEFLQEHYGTVQTLRVKSAFASRYASVQFDDTVTARAAYKALNGAKLMSKSILVQPTPKAAPPPTTTTTAG